MSVRSVTRALSVMECFDAERPSLPLHALSSRLGLAKSTTYRLVSTLVEAGYMVQKENGEYCLSLQLLRLAGAVVSSLDIRDIARSSVQDVSKRSGETVDLSMLSGHERICVDVVESPSPLKSICRVGERFVLFYGATGLTFLAFMDPATRAAVMRDAPADIRRDAGALERELEAIRERGYAVTTGQRVPGASSVSAPIFDINSQVRYCLSIGGPSARFSGREAEFSDLLVRACRSVSARLGHRPAA